MGSDRVLTQGTVAPWEPFIPEFIDCELLHKAFKGFARTDSKSIIDVLSTRSTTQRMQLMYFYKKKYDKDLYDQLDGALMGDFWKLVSAMMMSPVEYDAREINRVLKGLIKDEDSAVEILFTRTNDQIKQICDKYEELFHCKLWQDVTKEISGEIRHLFVDLLKAERHEDEDVDVERAAELAQRLSEMPLLGEHSNLRKLLVEESPEQLQETIAAYEGITEKPLDGAIEEAPEKIQKEYRSALKHMVKAARNLPGYFAERLYDSMKGLGTKDRTLIRLVVTRCEVDMVQIKEEFQRKYNDTLEEFIDDDTSGDYRKMLLALVGAVGDKYK